MAYATALSDWSDAGGYEAETLWDVCCTESLGRSYQLAKWRDVATLSGGEQKRLVLQALLRGADDVLVLDEPDNYLDVPSKQWLEQQLVDSPKTVLYVSHDRELLARPHRPARRHSGGVLARQHRLGARRRLRLVPPSPAGSTHPVRRAAAALGRGTVQARDAGEDPPAGEVVQDPGGGVPAGAARGDRAARTATAAADPHAPRGWLDRGARVHLQRSGADLAHRSLRPGGVLRRTRSRARCERHRQVALPAPARRVAADRVRRAHRVVEARSPSSTGRSSPSPTVAGSPAPSAGS